MASSLIDKPQRARLRETYMEAVRSLIQELQSRPKPACTRPELAQFGVTLQSMDPEDCKFTDSEACLFQPFAQKELERFKINTKTLADVDHRYFNEFKDTFYDVPVDLPDGEKMNIRASQIKLYLDIFESKSKMKRGRSTFSLRSLSHWVHIK